MMPRATGFSKIPSGKPSFTTSTDLSKPWPSDSSNLPTRTVMLLDIANSYFSNAGPLSFQCYRTMVRRGLPSIDSRCARQPVLGPYTNHLAMQAFLLRCLSYVSNLITPHYPELPNRLILLHYWPITRL